MSSYRGNAVGSCGQLRDCGHVGVDELRLEQQIFRRVTGQGKLGKRDDIRLQFDRAVRPLCNFPGVALDVSDNHIDLRHCKPQCLLHEKYRNRWEIVSNYLQTDYSVFQSQIFQTRRDPYSGATTQRRPNYNSACPHFSE
jgi:hypothetical protein